MQWVLENLSLALPRSRAIAASAPLVAALLLPFTAQAWTLKTLHSFQGAPDGAFPNGALLQIYPALYGTTSEGGAFGNGTVFKINPTTGHLTVVYAFGDSGIGGAGSQAALINVGGALYGTTYDSSSPDYGTVFKIARVTRAGTVVYSFAGPPDGADPSAALLGFEGLLYGTTTAGGGGTNCGGLACGTVFSIDAATRAEKVLHSFLGGNDGANPRAELINVGDTLYGTTVEGGAGGAGCSPVGCGTVFKIDPYTGAETVVYSFVNSTGFCGDGMAPYAALLNVSGSLYGTTLQGGTSCLGAVFKIDPVTGRETVLHSFSGGRDGANPEAALINAPGILYGTTNAGGTMNLGTVFQIHLATGAETVLHSFTGSDGAQPRAALSNIGPGVFYGTTHAGGAYGYGTVFSLAP